MDLNKNSYGVAKYLQHLVAFTLTWVVSKNIHYNTCKNMVEVK